MLFLEVGIPELRIASSLKIKLELIFPEIIMHIVNQELKQLNFLHFSYNALPERRCSPRHVLVSSHRSVTIWIQFLTRPANHWKKYKIRDVS